MILMLLRRSRALVGALLLLTSLAAAQTVSGLQGLHRDGQTFLTWNELSGTQYGYRVYRSLLPIATPEDLDQATFLGEVDRRSSDNRARGRFHWIIEPGGAELADSQGLYVHTLLEEEPVTGHYAVLVVQGANEDRTVAPGNTASVSGELAAPPQPVLQHANGGLEVWGHWTSNVDTPFQPALSVVPSHGHNFLYDPGSAPGPRGLAVRLHAAGQQYGIGWPHRFEVQADVDILALSDTIQPGGWTLWTGAHDTYPAAADPAGEVRLVTLRRAMWTLDWLTARLGGDHDPERVYAVGGSMGAMGAFYLASEYPDRFAAVLCRNGNYDLTASDVNNIAFIQDLLGGFELNLPIAAGVPSAGIPIYERMNVSLRPPFPPDRPGPLVRTINGRFDATVGWSSAVSLYQALASTHQPAVHYFDERDHHPFGYWVGLEPQLLARTFKTRRDRPSLRLSSLSVDDDPGVGTPASGDPVGCLNAYVDYDPETAAADAEACRFDVYLRAGGFLDDAPTSTASVVLTPGRTGAFAPTPGATVLFTWSEGTDPKVELDVQELTADAHGRVHTAPVEVVAEPREALFTLLVPGPPPPTVDALAATSDAVLEGESVTLSWTTTGADEIALDNGLGPVAAEGSLLVTPLATTTYVLTATNLGGSDSAAVTVAVSPPPPPPGVAVVDAFTALPGALVEGESTTLSWSTTNADAVALDGGIGAVAPDGSLVVTPLATTTYTLSATGAEGTATASVTVTVTPPPPPAIDAFAALPDVLVEGEATTLSWATSDADTVTLDNGIGAVAAGGSLELAPLATTTYVLTAASAAGTVTASVTVTVVPPPPSIDTFVAQPAELLQGETTTLQWTTSNADTVSLDNGIGEVVLQGSRGARPLQTTTYVLTATGPGGTATASVTVIVNQPTGPVVDLAVGDLPGTVARGDSFVLTVTATNSGDAASSSLTATVTTQGAEVRLRSPGTQQLGSLPVGGSASATWTIRARRAGSVTLTVVVTDQGGGTVGTASRTLQVQD